MHIYTQAGIDYPSVTTILHILGNDAITEWANSLGFRHKKYAVVLNQYAEFGTLAHSHLQAVVDPENAEPITPKDKLEAYDIDVLVAHFKRKLALYQYRTIFTEKTIIAPSLGYAGTLDWLAELNNRLVLNDFKTSKQARLTMFLQLGGYHNLLKTIGIDDIDAGNIIIANTKGCSFNPINASVLQQYGEIFNFLADFYFKYAPLTLDIDPNLLENPTT